MDTRSPRHPSRPGSLERAVRRELQRPVEHHFASPRVTPIDRDARAAARLPRPA